MYRPFATTTSQRLALRPNAFRELSQAADIPAGPRIRYPHLRTQQVLSSSHDYAYWTKSTNINLPKGYYL
jgi:hypothetical protein